MTATETTEDVKTIKPPRLGRGVAFGSEFGSGMTERALIATHLMPACMTDGGIPAEHAAAAAVRFADALLVELAK